jgi:hypothetical protein
MADSLFGPVIAKRVRDAIVLNLRRAFAADPDYTYAQNVDGTVNFDATKITINDVTPDDHLFFPTIIVSSLAGEEHRFLQEDFFNYSVDPNTNVATEIRGAPITFSVKIEATALDTIVRDEFLDRLYQKFKIIMDDMADNGVGVVKTSLLPDRREFPHDRWIYTSGVMMTLYGEWLEEEVVTSTVGSISGEVSTVDIDQPFHS